MAKKQIQVYTVSEITSLIKSVLEGGLPGRFAIAAEISGWKVYASGHAYFTLKDGNGVMPCVMWRSSLEKIKFSPDNGDAVLATGYIDVYEPSGRYQFYVDRMEPEGVGALQLAFEQLVKKLSAEGLFEDKYKKPLPKYPMRIGIVTSQSGAALHDIADSVYNRWPCAKMFLYPVLVQGDEAAGDIAKAITNINKANNKLKLDVLIVGRGGGSLEDLWAFNEEVVARAIFASRIPIISAVGHEVDTTIADFAADVRASTPTKAGVAAVPDIKDIQDRLEQMKNRLSLDLKRRCDYCNQRLETITASSVFRNPMSIVGQANQRIDELARDISERSKNLFAGIKAKIDRMYLQIQKIEPNRLIGNKRLELAHAVNRSDTVINNLLSKKMMQLTAMDNKFKMFSPQRATENKASELNNLDKQANAAIINSISRYKLQLQAIEDRLGSLNPRSVLNRGYSITVNSRTGNVITSPKDAEVGDVVITEMANKKTITSKVIEQNTE